MAQLEEHGHSICGVSTVSIGLTTSTSDREMPPVGSLARFAKEPEPNEWMARIQESLQNIELSVAAQAASMEQLAIAIGQRAPKSSPSNQRTSEQLPAENVQSIPVPGEMPPTLSPMVLGRVAEQSEESEFPRSDASFRKSNASRRRSRHSSGDGRASQTLDRFLASRDPQSSQYGMMNELEEHHAFRLIQARRTGRARSQTKKPRARSKENPARPDSPSPNRRAPTITNRAGAEDKEVMLSRVRRVSLEDLRNNYDAVLVSRAKLPTSTWETQNATALSRVAWCLLCLTGLLTFRDGRFFRLLSWMSFAVIPGCATLALASFSLTVGADVSVVVSLCCFAGGVLVATVSLKHAGISLLLGPSEAALDEYAAEAGFLRDWWNVSRWRAVEVAVFSAVALLVKESLNLLLTGSVLGATSTVVEIWTGVVFWILAVYFVVLAYLHLHICCGLELAVDSFGLRFFKEMNMEQAIQEWNQVQATLRQVSRKLSGSLLLLGSSCLACLAILAEKVIQQPGMLTDPALLLPWVGWFYPLILLFLYTMFRAAAVTEKASRVAPLINAWTFHDPDQDEEQDTCWMDQDRQYVVQYINQSEAGFYIRGARLTVFNVQKMAYYFAALSFALFSQISALP